MAKLAVLTPLISPKINIVPSASSAMVASRTPMDNLAGSSARAAATVTVLPAMPT